MNKRLSDEFTDVLANWMGTHSHDPYLLPTVFSSCLKIAALIEANVISEDPDETATDLYMDWLQRGAEVSSEITRNDNCFSRRSPTVLATFMYPPRSPKRQLEFPGFICPPQSPKRQLAFSSFN